MWMGEITLTNIIIIQLNMIEQMSKTFQTLEEPNLLKTPIKPFKITQDSPPKNGYILQKHPQKQTNSHERL